MDKCPSQIIIYLKQKALKKSGASLPMFEREFKLKWHPQIYNICISNLSYPRKLKLRKGYMLTKWKEGNTIPEQCERINGS